MQFVFSSFLSLTLLALVSISTIAPGASESYHVLHGWGYEKDNGPHLWCKSFPICCGSRQSPIPLVPSVSKQVEYAKLVFTNYDLKRNFQIENDGHTVIATLADGLGWPTISGGGLQDVYVFNSFHFHWGHDNTLGAEHTLDGLQFPIEGHFVHVNSKYPNISEARLHPDGIAVFAVLHNVSCLSNTDLAPLIDELENVKHADQTSKVKSQIVLRNLFPSNLDQFYRYLGSLTSPPCSEAVTWTIFDEIVGISDKQLNEFRSDIHIRKTGQSEPLLLDNHRYAQNATNREVTHNVFGPRTRSTYTGECNDIPKTPL